MSIQVNIDNKSSVKVVIYDELGRQVGNRFTKELYTDNNTIDFDLNNYKSGIYFISLNIDNQIFTKQFIKR